MMKTFTEDAVVAGLNIGLPIVRRLAKKERDAEWRAVLEGMKKEEWTLEVKEEGFHSPMHVFANELLTRMEATK